jgi:hypothetical protein
MASCGSQPVVPLYAVALLSQQYFFTSPKVANMATQAEILQKVRQCQIGPHGHVMCPFFNIDLILQILDHCTLGTLPRSAIYKVAIVVLAVALYMMCGSRSQEQTVK